MEPIFMEIVKNKMSGKYFVVLDDTEDNRLLAVTPEGKIKSLERHLFVTHDLLDPMDKELRKYLTKTQMNIYMEYFNE